MNKNLETHNKIYIVKDTAVEKDVTTKYFTGNTYRKQKVSELFKHLYDGQEGQFLLSIDIDTTTNKYTVKLSPVEARTNDETKQITKNTEVPQNTVIANWVTDCNHDNWYTYCSNCKKEPICIERRLPVNCPHCGAYMENTAKYIR